MYRHDIIRAKMAAMRLRDKDLADKTGLNRTSVMQIRNGSVVDPKISNLEKIAAALDIPLHELFVPAEPGKEAVA